MNIENITLLTDPFIESTYNKKIIENWLEKLPEPYRSQAFENIRLQNNEYKLIYNTYSKKSALSRSFTWAQSPQGHKYWQNFHESLR